MFIIKLSVFALILFISPYSLSTESYPLLKVTKAGKVSYFIPSMHGSNEIMKGRLMETMKCMPEVGSIVFEINPEDPTFSIIEFAIKINAGNTETIPSDLLKKLDDLGNKAMPKPKHLMDQASILTKLGIHPGILLFILDQPIRNYVLFKHGWDAYGASFEAILSKYAKEKNIPIKFLESPQQALTAFTKIKHDEILEQFQYLIELNFDRDKQNDLLTSMDVLALPLQYGDWTNSKIDNVNNSLKMGYSKSYIEEIVTQRSVKMIKAFDKAEKTEKPALVAIGFGHFGGKLDVISRLISLGYKIEKFEVDCKESSEVKLK